MFTFTPLSSERKITKNVCNSNLTFLREGYYPFSSKTDQYFNQDTNTQNCLTSINCKMKELFTIPELKWAQYVQKYFNLRKTPNFVYSTVTCKSIHQINDILDNFTAHVMVFTQKNYYKHQNTSCISKLLNLNIPDRLPLWAHYFLLTVYTN